MGVQIAYSTLELISAERGGEVLASTLLARARGEIGEPAII
jgi:hypothetical protein